jgi:hypothetical protein
LFRRAATGDGAPRAGAARENDVINFPPFALARIDRAQAMDAGAAVQQPGEADRDVPPGWQPASRVPVKCGADGQRRREGGLGPSFFARGPTSRKTAMPNGRRLLRAAR